MVKNSPNPHSVDDQITADITETLDYIGSYFITKKERRTRIEVYRQDTKIVRNVGQSAAKMERTKTQIEARRAAVTRLTEPSLARALWNAKNGGPWQFIATLNYGSGAPTDGKIVKSHIDRLATRIVRSGLSLFWKLEFSLSGRPHFHVLLTGKLAHRPLLVAWAGVIGTQPRPNMLKIEKIQNAEAVTWYITKRAEDIQNWVPPAFTNMGRFWGRRGPDAKPRALTMIEATESEIAPIVRTARKIAKAKKGRKTKDGGAVSKKLYGVGGESVAISMKRQAERLGFRPIPADLVGAARRRRNKAIKQDVAA